MNRIEQLKEEMLDWVEGRRDWCNLGHSPDVTATMNAQEVVKLSAAIQALESCSSRRERIATAVLAGFAADDCALWPTAEHAAREAVKWADSLIAELDKALEEKP